MSSPRHTLQTLARSNPVCLNAPQLAIPQTPHDRKLSAVIYRRPPWPSRMAAPAQAPSAERDPPPKPPRAITRFRLRRSRTGVQACNPTAPTDALRDSPTDPPPRARLDTHARINPAREALNPEDRPSPGQSGRAPNRQYRSPTVVQPQAASQLAVLVGRLDPMRLKRSDILWVRTRRRG